MRSNQVLKIIKMTCVILKDEGENMIDRFNLEASGDGRKQ